jgi:hypothetical protein
LFSNIRTTLDEADRHDLRAHNLAGDLDLADFVDLDEDAIDVLKKGFVDISLMFDYFRNHIFKHSQARAFASREVLFRLIPNFEKKTEEESAEVLLDYFKQVCTASLLYCVVTHTTLLPLVGKGS